MDAGYPEPDEVGIRIPPHLKQKRFRDGFRHALKGGQLDKAIYMRLSFREGYRAAKIYLRQLRRSRGILDFPARWRMRIRTA
jgi:hypothetical protein